MCDEKVPLLLSRLGSWLKVSDELQSVVSSSQLGKHMFGWAWQGIRAENIQIVIDAAAKNMAESKVTEASFSAYRSKCWEEINKLDSELTSLPNMRSITATYRGVSALPSVASLLSMRAVCLYVSLSMR